MRPRFLGGHERPAPPPQANGVRPHRPVAAGRVSVVLTGPPSADPWTTLMMWTPPIDAAVYLIAEKLRLAPSELWAQDVEADAGGVEVRLFAGHPGGAHRIAARILEGLTALDVNLALTRLRALLERDEAAAEDAAETLALHALALAAAGDAEEA